jgi:hypothetical protein
MVTSEIDSTIKVKMSGIYRYSSKTNSYVYYTILSGCHHCLGSHRGEIWHIFITLFEKPTFKTFPTEEMKTTL